jgi:hypothetical protein
MRIAVLLATSMVLCGATGALAGEACFAPQSNWSFGGAGFDNTDVAKLDKHACPPFKNCHLGAPDGFNYALVYDNGTAVYMLGMKQRSIGLGEKLPFGVTTVDTPDQVAKKLEDAGRKPDYGRTRAIYPASVGLLCQDGAVSYQFEFNFDVMHRMTNISETPLHGDQMYMDDPTKSFTPVDEVDQ